MVWLGAEGVSGSRAGVQGAVVGIWQRKGCVCGRSRSGGGYCGVVPGEPLLCGAWRCRLCRSGEAGGAREAAAGKKSPRAMTKWQIVCAWEWALGAGCSNAARSVRACCSLKTSGGCTAAQKQQRYAIDCMLVQVGETASARLPDATSDNSFSYAMLQASLPQITPDRVAVAFCALAIADVSCLSDSQHIVSASPIPVRHNGHVDSTNRARGNARRLRQATGAAHIRTHYPNACATRHRLLFAASRS
jgi:hypothetical protein